LFIVQSRINYVEL